MILLDTHALLWWRADGGKLSRPAARQIDAAAAIGISPMSFWEVALLVDKGRVRLDRTTYQWVDDVLAEDRVELVPFTSTAAVGAGRLPSEGFHGDPADAILYATARELAVPLVSKDRRIRDHAATAHDLKVVW